MEDLFGIDHGGTDGRGHLGYAAASGLRPFGNDIYNNPTGRASAALAAGGLRAVYPATAGGVDVPTQPTYQRVSG
jgi:hypothetical protein